MPGPLRGGRGRRRHLIEIDAWVTGGRLRADFTYSRGCHRHSTLSALAESFAANLRALLAEQGSPAAGALSRQEIENAFAEVEL